MAGEELQSWTGKANWDPDFVADNYYDEEARSSAGSGDTMDSQKVGAASCLLVGCGMEIP